MVTLDGIANFIFRYAAEYRGAYSKATSPPPSGPGYPGFQTSPYLASSTFSVYVTDKGVVINHEGSEPPYQWFIAGGPAFKVDYEPTRTPPEVVRILEQHDLKGKNIGIYRIVAKDPLEDAIWRGEVTGITKSISVEDDNTGIQLHVNRVAGGLTELLAQLTFGAFGRILDAHLPNEDSAIGTPHVIEGMGVFPADLNNKRFLNRLEIFGQSDSCAWDLRLTHIRAHLDVRNDFARALSSPPKETGGFLSFGNPNAWIKSYSDRLENLRGALSDLRSALQVQGEEVESVFHAVLERHPLLLDVYGQCESKPRFKYPEDSRSPVGKAYLEPDFLIRYPNRSYKLVEIERPSKSIATAQGQPTAQVGQAVFQTAEWKHYIKSHYQEIVDRYPGIQSYCKTCVIMSRTQQRHFADENALHDYVGLMMEQYGIDEFLTFDDLYDRASHAYALLSGLQPAGI